MPRSLTFATIADYLAAKATTGSIYAALVSSGIKSGSCVSKITATGDVFVDSINPFVTPDLGQEGDTLYYSATEGYRCLRAGNSAWDATSYGQVFIDLAKLPSGFSVVAPYSEIFTFKRTEDIGSGRSSMSKIKGNSVAWNQLAHGDFSDATAWDKTDTISSFTVSDNIGTITVNSIVNSFCRITDGSVSYISGHKYYFGCDVLSDKAILTGFYYSQYIDTITIEAGKWWHSSKIITYSGSRNGFAITVNRNSVLSDGDTVQVKNAICLDLTLMFGEGKEPATVEEFEALFPGYYANNQGQLLSNKAKAIEFVGFNQWNEEWEEGVYNTGNGQKQSGANRLRSANKINVLPETTYYLKFPTPYYFRLLEYDKDDNYLGSYQFGTNVSYTTSAKCRKIAFCLINADITTYNHDICINLSGPRNGQYEPYKKTTLQVPITALRGKLNGQGASVNIFPDGLKSAGDVYDEIGNGYAIKRIGTVDMGTLYWSGTTYYSASIPNKKIGYFNLFTPKYVAIIQGGGGTGTSVPEGKISGASATNIIFLNATSASSSSDLRTALQGVMLNYELAEPEYYVLDREFNFKYRTSPYHTKKMLPENGEEPTSAPFACEIKL